MRNQPFTFSGTPQDGTLSDGLLVINGGKIKVAGNTIEGVTQVGSSHGKIYSIELRVIKIVFRYEIVINGQADYVGGNWFFSFTDEEPDTYSLSIFNPITADHTVKFGSVAPNIVKVTWTKSP